MGTLRSTMPTPSAIDAAVSLLVDPDPRVAAVCRQQLLAWGRTAQPALQAAAGSPNQNLRLAARVLLRQMELRWWRRGMKRLAVAMARKGASAHRDYRLLQAGALMLASVGHTHALARREVVRALDQHGELLCSSVRGRSPTAAAMARALKEYLGARCGFSGRAASRYRRRDIEIDKVLVDRTGTSAALAVVYILVGRRAGMPMSAVALMDRILVRVHGARSVLLDPRRGGRTMTKAECAADLRARGVRTRPQSMLEELDDRQLLLRLLDNFRRVHGYREDVEILQALATSRTSLERALG